jgi:hypothetical protein
MNQKNMDYIWKTKKLKAAEIEKEFFIYKLLQIK